jgi:nucleotide-binding universal stress UspA family protein
MSADIDSDTNRGGTDAAVRTQSGTAGVATADSEPTGLFERVLVVADGDTTGDAAVAAGIDLAATHGASVDALYVVDTTEAWDMVVERNEREGERAVEAAAARGTARGVDVEKWFRYGTAHEEVLGFAEAHDVDCIVVGSARRTGLDRLIHPNPLPARLQRDGSVPVLVVGADD